jgi:hydantoinase/carbamoylase family amidase
MVMTTVQQLTINSRRLQDDFNELSDIGANEGGGISRLALSNEDLEGRAWFANKIEEAGLLIRDDEVGNLSGVLVSQNPKAKTFLMGSHLDTVPNGGKYDGVIGVLCALECLRTIKEADMKLPVHLEAIDFTDEEGTWQSFFGSLGLTGKLQASHLNDFEQDNGAFRVALFRAGIRPAEVHRAKRNPSDLAGYLELHIEQSETLDKLEKQIGIVTKIVGRSTYNFDFHGEATHAATTSRYKQRDALQGASRFIIAMHDMTREAYPEGVVNCGNVRVQPGAYNVVPELASLRVECRHHDETILAAMENRLVQLAHECAKHHHLTISAKNVLRRRVAEMNPRMIEAITEVCQEQQRTYMPLISYAGHDAQILSPFIPTAMIFVPSKGGISHSPKEYTAWEDIVAGANVMLHTVLRLVADE